MYQIYIMINDEKEGLYSGGGCMSIDDPLYECESIIKFFFFYLYPVRTRRRIDVKNDGQFSASVDARFMTKTDVNKVDVV